MSSEGVTLVSESFPSHVTTGRVLTNTVKEANTEVSTQQTSHENPLADFGPNEWIVDEMYQRYLADPTSVDPAWHDFFADYKPAMATGSIVTPEATISRSTTPAIRAPDTGAISVAAGAPAGGCAVVSAGVLPLLVAARHPVAQYPLPGLPPALPARRLCLVRIPGRKAVGSICHCRA